MSDDLRMSAYYYSFDSTGQREIDLILSAVACAGKAFHHTEGWSEECAPYDGHEGDTPEAWIKNAAQKAAAEIARLRAENERLRFGCALAEAQRDDEIREADRLRAELDAAREKYSELIMAVGRKYPGETRHETALRYIRTAEIVANSVGAACEGRKP